MDTKANEDTNIDIVRQTLKNEYFDKVIGHIEDIVLSETFENLHIEFLERYWLKFDDCEENKLEYMEIFKEYTEIFEKFFMQELYRRMENFDMEIFAQQLNVHKSLQDSLDSEIFELLFSFSNFQIFKSLMLDYRRKKEGLVQHLDLNILITKPLQQITNLLDADDDACSIINSN